MKKQILLFLMMFVLVVCFIPRVLMAGNASPVIDANNYISFYDVRDYGIFNNKLYFSGFGSFIGAELYEYDGIRPPRLTADIRPGMENSNPRSFIVFNNKLYFFTDIGLYAYDGVNPPAQVANIHSNGPFVEFNGKLYFACYTYGYGEELWEFDGVNPPQMVQDINPGPSNSLPSSFCVYGGKLYFSGYTPASGIEIFMYDGVNPVEVAADIFPGPNDSNANNLIAWNGRLYFWVLDYINSENRWFYELWSYDFNNPPAMVADINPSGGSEGGYMVVFNNRLYFFADDGVHGHELWFYDGSNPPEMVQDIYTGPYDASPSPLVVSNGQLFFGIQDYESRLELWTCSSTNSVTRVADPSTQSQFQFFQCIFEFNNTIYFGKNTYDMTDMWKYSDPSLFVSVPNANEIWLIGTQETITWTADASITHVNIAYSTDCGDTWIEIANSAANTGSYNLTVPDTPSSQCLVKITDTNGSLFDVSNNIFIIKYPMVIDVTYPNGGEYVAPGSYVEITCTVSNTLGEEIYNIEYSMDAGNTWNLIHNGPMPVMDGVASCEWAVPETQSSTCLIRVSETTTQTSDTSDAYFRIEPPRDIFIIEPTYGSICRVGDTKTILWDWTGNITYVRIEYSSDSGQNWNLISASALNTGNYDWTVPAPPSDQCMIKITDIESGIFGSIPEFRILPADAMISLEERNALIALYNATNGDSWYDNSGWRDPQDPTRFNDRGTEHTWRGVTLNTDQSHVIGLDFNNFQFTGIIPDLSALTQLEYLDLAFNHLSGTIPSSITNLTNLSYFNLRSCQLSGPLPLSILNMDNPSFAIGIAWNAVYTDDPQVKAFIDAHHFSIYYKTSYINWTETETVAPKDVLVSEVNSDSVVLSWTPILFQGETGGYRVYYSTTSGGGYTLASATVNKSINTLTVTGLEPETTYYFVVETFTNPHQFNNNTVVSEYSEEVSTTTQQARTITVTAPNGGESWEGNTSHAITWTYTGNIPNVMIEYSTNNGSSWNTIAVSTSNTGSYNWTVPNSPATACLVKVSDAAGPAVDQSNAVFTILTERTVTVTAPNGGESWEGNTSHAITWTYTGNIPNVMIEYSTNNGSSWNTIAASTSNTGSYNWTVPNSPSTTCLVKVSDAAGPAVDQSNATFTIAAERTLTVTAPNGGESWEGNTSHAITWTSTGDISNVKIEYSTTGGSSWNTITVSTANSGSYNWPVPNSPSTTCLVKVSDAAGPAVDQSNAVFTILTERTVTVTAPNGGETWEGNTSHAITWTYTGSIPNVMIEYSLNSGSSWNTIAASTANTGSYNWSVPNSPAATCLVRVSDAAGPASDQSNAVFTILTERTVTVTAPNGGESIEGNTSHSITWTYTGSIPNVMIEYSTNSGSSWNTIAASTANTGSYNWSVPNSPAATCLVRVSDAAGPASDQSNAVFVIAAYRTITVSLPNGAENLLANTIYPITWTNTGNIPNVKLEYSTNNGSSWNTIITSTSNTGSYNWTLPAAASTSCLIKVSDTAGPALDQSNAVFTISNVTYCTSSGSSQTRGYISRVQVGNLDNSSGSSAYSDFSTLNANLTSGGSAGVSLTPTFPGSTYIEYWKIWIDYNRDGDFADTGENVFSNFGSSTVTGSFTVSASAAKGTARMRVSMKTQNNPPSCGALNYGEVEDYTVIIQ